MHLQAIERVAHGQRRVVKELTEAMSIKYEPGRWYAGKFPDGKNEPAQIG